MEKLIILSILLIVVGFIIFSIVKNQKRGKKELLERAMPLNPSSEAEPIESPLASCDAPHGSCALATTLRIVGVANVFAALIIGLVLADDFGWVISIAAILSGCLGCLFCYALAKCVDAADKYLNSH